MQGNAVNQNQQIILFSNVQLRGFYGIFPKKYWTGGSCLTTGLICMIECSEMKVVK